MTIPSSPSTLITFHLFVGNVKMDMDR